MKPTANGAILIAMLFTLTACSVNKPDTAATQIPVPTTAIHPTVNPTQTEEPKPLICIITPPIVDHYWDPQSPGNVYYASMQEIAAAKVEELGYTALKLTHDDDANKQEEQIDMCITQHAVAILLDHVGADATVPAIQKAKEAGIPTFLIDREISQEGVAVSQIIPNNDQGATLVAEYFAELMGKQGKYIELTGRDTDPNAHLRSDGFHSVLDKLPDMEMIAQQTATWAASEPFDTVETLLLMYPEVDGIIAGYDSMAGGAQAALLAAGRTDVIVVGMGGSDDVIESIMEGGIDATVLWPVVEMATEAAIQADLYIRTGSTGQPEKQYLDMILLTPENACMYTAFAPNGKSNCP